MQFMHYDVTCVLDFYTQTICWFILRIGLTACQPITAKLCCVVLPAVEHYDISVRISYIVTTALQLLAPCEGK